MLMAEDLQIFWDWYNNLFEEWNVWTIFETEYFLTCYLRFLQIEYIKTIEVPIETNNWDVEANSNKLEKIIFNWNTKLKSL